MENVGSMRYRETCFARAKVPSGMPDADGIRGRRVGSSTSEPVQTWPCRPGGAFVMYGADLPHQLAIQMSVFSVPFRLATPGQGVLGRRPEGNQIAKGKPSTSLSALTSSS